MITIKIIQIKAHCSSVVIFLVSNPVPSITVAHADLFVPVWDRAIRLPIGKFQGDVYHFSLLLHAHHLIWIIVRRQGQTCIQIGSVYSEIFVSV